MPKEHGGTDKYDNLVLITSNVHRLIHAKTHETIEKYRVMLNLSNSQLAAVNALRNKAFLPAIKMCIRDRDMLDEFVAKQWINKKVHTSYRDQSTKMTALRKRSDLIPGVLVRYADDFVIVTDSREPVSYTHLDVYKRQPRMSAAGCRAILTAGVRILKVKIPTRTKSSSGLRFSGNGMLSTANPTKCAAEMPFSSG